MSFEKLKLLFLHLEYAAMENLISDFEILKDKEKPCDIVHISKSTHTGNSRKLYMESYGCQMNFSDSEIVASILKKEGLIRLRIFTLQMSFF